MWYVGSWAPGPLLKSMQRVKGTELIHYTGISTFQMQCTSVLIFFSKCPCIFIGWINTMAVLLTSKSTRTQACYLAPSYTCESISNERISKGKVTAEFYTSALLIRSSRLSRKLPPFSASYYTI